MDIIFKMFLRHFISNLKGAIKLALLSMLIFFTIGLLISIILLNYFHTDYEIAGMVAGVVSSIIILFIDFKKTHILIKMHKNYMETEMELEKLNR